MVTQENDWAFLHRIGYPNHCKTAAESRSNGVYGIIPGHIQKKNRRQPLAGWKDNSIRFRDRALQNKKLLYKRGDDNN
jgi:hypothetical protein